MKKKMICSIFASIKYILTDYMCHAFVRGDSLAGVLISDHEYPQRVSFTLLSRVRKSLYKFIFTYKQVCYVHFCKFIIELEDFIHNDVWLQHFSFYTIAVILSQRLVYTTPVSRP